MLPDIARELDVSDAAAGRLATVFAIDSLMARTAGTRSAITDTPG